MELQACEKADEITLFVKSFGNHNTSLSTNATAELLKYNIWYRKHFGNKRLFQQYLLSVVEIRGNKYWKGDHFLPGVNNDKLLPYFPEYEYGNGKRDMSTNSTLNSRFLKQPYHLYNNPQKLSIIEMALCYGMTLDYDKISECWENDSVQKENFTKNLYDLLVVSRFKVLDSAMFALIESEILSGNKIDVFCVNNVSDFMTELLALGKSPSGDFLKILDNMIQLSRNPDTPIPTLLEQYVFLPHTLVDDLLSTSHSHSAKDENFEKEVDEICQSYANIAQLVTDSLVFQQAEELDDNQNVYIPGEMKEGSMYS